MSDEEANLFSLQLRSEAFFCSSFSIFFHRVRTKNSRGNQSTWTWSGKKITMEKLLSMEQIMFMKLADQSGALAEALCWFCLAWKFSRGNEKKKLVCIWSRRCLPKVEARKKSAELCCVLAKPEFFSIIDTWLVYNFNFHRIEDCNNSSPYEASSDRCWPRELLFLVLENFCLRTKVSRRYF